MTITDIEYRWFYEHTNWAAVFSSLGESNRR
jgi:hypothetical protein